MKIKLCLGIFLLAAAAVAPAQTNSLTALLQQGLFEEQASRNLDAAIADYQSLALQFDQDRQLAATAVFRLGECYRAQGRTNEATAQYQRILHDFSDQQTLARLSREDLAGMGASVRPPVAERSAATTKNAEPEGNLELVKKLQAMPLSEIRQMAPTLLTDATLINLIYQYNQCDLDLLRLQADHATNQPEVKKVLEIEDGLALKIKERLDGLHRALTLELAASGSVQGDAVVEARSKTVTDDEDREIQRIQQMIQNSPDLINAPLGNIEMGTPLVKAAYHGWLKVAAYLLEHGADVNNPCTQVSWSSELQQVGRATPLLAAVAAGNKAMTKFLIERGADINFQGDNGDMALSLAARKGFQAVIEVLLASHALVNAQNSHDGTTPLFSAVASGRVKIIQMLLAAGADANVKDNKGRTILNYAIKTSPEIMQALLAAGTKPNTEDAEGRTPLSYAAQRDSTEVVKLLLAAKADPNLGTLDAPLLCAIHEKNAATAEALLQSGAQSDAPGKVDWQPHSVNFHYEGALGRGLATPLWLAVDMDQSPMVQLLLKHKADPNDALDGQSLLFRALSDTNILASLLEAGGSVEARRTDGWTLLASAVAQKQFTSVQWLLKFKADPNKSQIQGESMLFYTLTETNILEALLDAGAKVDPVTKDESNWTPLGAAARNNNAAALEILLKHGANPNVRSANGITPLHFASYGPADGKVFELLLAAKADPNVRNSSGETPLDLLKRSTTQKAFPPSPGMPSRLPPRYPIPGMPEATPDSQPTAATGEPADLLRQHGALDELPDFTRIRITRQGLPLPLEVFRNEAKQTNQFTLLETVMRFYSLPQVSAFGQTHEPWRALPFPDFGRISIRRPSQTIGGKEQEIKVSLLNRSNVVDCAHDVPVEFGDVIEIPESVHALNAELPNPVGEMEEAFAPASLTGPFFARLASIRQPGGEESLARVNAYRTSTLCLQKAVQLVVAGETTTFKVNSWKEGFLSQALTKTEARSVLRSSSDLSRLTVTRKSVGSGKPIIFTVDVSGNAPNHDDLWLQDGDVITVPDKP